MEAARKRRLFICGLYGWTILTCALVAVAVWGVLGAPDYATGPHLPSRSLTAAVR